MRVSILFIPVCALACVAQNDIPSAGSCDVDMVDPAPQAVAIALTGKAAPFDDLRYAAALDRVLAVPPGAGTLHLVDPHDDSVVTFSGLPAKVTSADATADHIYVGDRGSDRVLVLDAENGSIVGMLDVGAGLDYVRVTPDGHELWTTMPGQDRIAVHALDDAGMPSEVASIAMKGGPEGLAFDASGTHAYAHLFDGRLVAIDVAARERIATWETGCASAHGFPQVDEERGLVFAGCSSEGAAVVLDAETGKRLAGFSSGGDAAISAYSSTLHHFYLRGDPGGDLAILAVCDDGDMTEIASVTLTDRGHGMTADAHGNVWVCDEDTGGLLKIRDPLAGP